MFQRVCALVRSTCVLLFIASAGASACQGGSGASDGGVGAGLIDARQAATTGRYIPLSVGAGWTWNGYDTLSGKSGLTDSRVEALDTLSGTKAGIKAFRVRSTTLGGATVNWQEDTGTAIIRHQEQFLDATGALASDHLFAPGKLRLDEAAAHVVAGAAWTETYTDMVTASVAGTTPTTNVTVTWTVEAVDESVTVPAGTFNCLRVRAVQTGGAAYDSTFWFARNVGKVKEGGTETRELVGYNIP